MQNGHGNPQKFYRHPPPPPNISRNGERCLNKCENAGEKYTWCYVGKQESMWDYCAPKGLTIYSNPCVGECQEKEGLVRSETYWWCRTDQEDESKWDYCSPDGKVSTIPLES